MDRDDQILTAREVAEIMRLDERTIKTLLQKGEIPGRKFGRQWRCRRGDLYRHLIGDLQPAGAR